MVLDDEYGEFEMLSTEIVKMVEDFEGWEYPNLESLTHAFKNSDEASYSETWSSYNLYNMFKESYFPRLEKHELDCIKIILESELNDKNSYKCHSLVSSFVKWYFEHSNCLNDIESEYYEYWQPYTYYIEGKIPYDGFEPGDVEKISFFKDYHNRQYFHQMGPHWLNWFRKLIREQEDQPQSN
jgi:hypothetical protein